MQVLNNNPLDLRGADREVLTVRVVSSGTQNLVSYTIDGQTRNLPTGVDA